MKRENRRQEAEAIAEGEMIPFGDYLERVAPKRTRPVIWRVGEIAERLSATATAERGTMALIDPNGADKAAIAPGLSCVIQVVPPTRRTTVHSHSFWHLCLVRSGGGAVSIGDDGGEEALSAGETLFIPAWCPHAFSNRASAPLIMMVIQNLPGLAEAGTVVRQDASEPIRVVYGDAADD
jgi:gentisate 1,2-dioxygenase